jgi:hypothetical protein
MKEDDYESLAGMILYYHGSIPVENEIIRIRNLIIKALKVSITRLELIRQFINL